MPDPVFVQYAEKLEGAGYGWFVYQPVDSRNLYPGAVGYFDHRGTWRTIATVSDTRRGYPVHIQHPECIKSAGASTHVVAANAGANAAYVFP